jgi:hypothetical protein
MSHFAQVIDGIVQEVIVAGQDFIDTLSDPQNWIETSYNTRGNLHYNPSTGLPDKKFPLRGNFAGIGYTYDLVNDVFYGPQPFPSWILNTTTWQWEAPIPMPTSKGNWIWDEPSLKWILATDNTLATN